MGWWSRLKTIFKGYKNLGHRFYDHSEYENTFLAFAEGLKHQDIKGFKYFEFDVGENKDGTLWVFHDWTKRKTIERMCPTAPKSLLNRPIYSLSDKQIKSLKVLDRDIAIPCLKEVLDWFRDAHIKKPVMVEIKRVRSIDAKKEMLNLVEHLKETNPEIDIYFGSFESKFKKNFHKEKKGYEGSREWFYDELEERNLRIKLW